MSDPFVHLHVASGYSLQYGASHPHVLVERAAEQEMDALALTDRDGTYGAVRFVKATAAAGIRPILGVDLAFAADQGRSGPAEPPASTRARTPVRGGASRDARLPRVTFLASGRRGWAAVCRLVSATHAAGERGTPVCTPALVAEHVAGAAGDVRVLLGPASELGRAAALRRDDLGAQVLRRWLDLVGPEHLVVEVVSHRLPGAGPGSSPHAARMTGLARRGLRGVRVPVVLSNAVRFADRLDAPTTDVLDAARRLVPMDLRHLDRRNAEGFLKSGKQMHEVAEEICRFAGLEGSRGATDLLAATRTIADQCVLDPRADLGLGEVHFPEFEITARSGPGVAGGVPTPQRAWDAGAAGALVDGTGPLPSPEASPRVVERPGVSPRPVPAPGRDVTGSVEGMVDGAGVDGVPVDGTGSLQRLTGGHVSQRGSGGGAAGVSVDGTGPPERGTSGGVVAHPGESRPPTPAPVVATPRTPGSPVPAPGRDVTGSVEGMVDGAGAAGALVDGTGPLPSPEASSRAVERPGVFRVPPTAAAAGNTPQHTPTATAWRPTGGRSAGGMGGGGAGPIRPPVTVITRDTPADAELHRRCDGAIGWRYGSAPRQRIWKRLDDELDTIRRLGFASYFLTVGEITQMVHDLGIRSAARGSGAGSLVNYLLGISGIDPIRHGLLMERFLSPLRVSLPDIDLDVESARRLEVYDAILERYGHERCATVSMMDTYKVRHAIRDVGAALGMPVGEIDTIAKAFPHIRARDARMALRDLPELRATGLAREAAAGDWGSFDQFFRLVESLDGLPRHIAMHPCGVLLSDRTLLDRTPVEQSFLGYPMSQFDKEDVEDLGLLKLDVLGIRMQSSMAHAVAEIERTEGRHIDLDDEVQVPFDDQRTYDMISSAKTLGVFQIESPGQRELVGKSGIETFEDIIADISLFRPGPVKSDMITPYLEVKNGWKQVSYLHDDLRPILERTRGVVVYHEQIIEMIATFAGVSYAEGDEWRRALGDTEGMAETRSWFFPRALGRGYPLPLVEQIWKVIESFASFGFCKAHAAAFALPTYQSAWLKAHYPAHFLAGVLTHDPGMYPKRLILDDARQLGIEVLGLDVNLSEAEYVVEQVADTTPTRAPDDVAANLGRYRRRGGIYTKLSPEVKDQPAWMGHGWGIRIALGEVRGINDAEVARIVGGRNAAPYASLTDFWQRAQVARPVVERLVQAGGFDSIYGIGTSAGAGRRHRMTRRDLLLEIGDLDRLRRAADRANAPRARGLSRSRPKGGASPGSGSDPGSGSFQLALDLGGSPDDPTTRVSGLPEMTDSDRVRAELDILGLDASRHVVEFHAPFLDRLGITRSADLLSARSRSELLVAGVKVATQTPPIRSGRRVIFLTLDDATGPVDATFFEDAQGPYAATVFGSWLLVVRGELRRTGRRGVSLRATGAWDLGLLHDLWRAEGMDAVHAEIARTPEGYAGVGPAQGTSRVLVHTSGFRMSPYADIKPAGHSTGTVTGEVARKLWHRSPGSAG